MSVVSLFICISKVYRWKGISRYQQDHYDNSLVALAIISAVLFGDYAVYGLC